MIEWIITTGKTWPGMLVWIAVGMAVITGGVTLLFFIANIGSFVTAPGGLKPRRRTKQDVKETAERLASDRQQHYWDFMAEFLENNAEKHQLSTADLANIKKYEQGLGRSLAAPTGFILLGLFFIAIGIMGGDVRCLSLGGVIMAITAIAIVVEWREAGKRVYAAQCGWCDAYVLEVTEKLWSYELPDSDGGGGNGFEFYVRCNGVVLQVPTKVCRGIGRHVLVVRYLYNRQKDIALEQRGLKPKVKLYYYPGTM